MPGRFMPGERLGHGVGPGDPDVVTHQREEPPEGEEDRGLHAVGRTGRPQDQGRPHLVEIAAPGNDRHALRYVCVPAVRHGPDPLSFSDEALPTVIPDTTFVVAHITRPSAELAGDNVADTVTPLELFQEIADGRVPEILDVRNIDEFEASRVEGSRPVPTRNVPVYRVFEDLEGECARTARGCGRDLRPGQRLRARRRGVRRPRARPSGRSRAGPTPGTGCWCRSRSPGCPAPVRVWQFQRPAKACLSYVVGRARRALHHRRPDPPAPALPRPRGRARDDRGPRRRHPRPRRPHQRRPRPRRRPGRGVPPAAGGLRRRGAVPQPAAEGRRRSRPGVGAACG